jgi:hypothetical protein
MTTRSTRTIGLLIAVSLLSACAWWNSTGKPIARTIADAARLLCELGVAEEPPETLQGLSPAAFCAVEDNVRPFVDAALAAQQMGLTGLKRSEADLTPADGGAALPTPDGGVSLPAPDSGTRE